MVSAILLCAACGSSENASTSGSATQQPAGGKAASSGAPATSTGGAPAAITAAGPSRLVYTNVDPDKTPVRVEVSGAALARQMNDGRFLIYVYSTDVSPPPSCDAIHPAELNTGKGSEIGIVIYDFKNKPGKVKAKEALIDHRKPSGELESIDDLHGPDVDILAIDGSTLRATVVTPDPPSEQVARVNGTIVATLCAPQK